MIRQFAFLVRENPGGEQFAVVCATTEGEQRVLQEVERYYGPEAIVEPRPISATELARRSRRGMPVTMLVL